jgi:hypothetical protein
MSNQAKTLSKNQYLYPSHKSYIASSQGSRSGPLARGADRRLEKAVIYSMQTRKSGSFSQTSNIPGIPVEDQRSYDEIDYTMAKVVQFNQPEQRVSIGAEVTTPTDAEQQGGAVSEKVGQLGIGSTSFEFMFERQAEVFRGSNGEAKYREFADIGVVSDVLDIYAIVTRNVPMFKREGEYASSANMNKVAREMYDLVGVGSKTILTNPIAIQLNPKFVFYGILKDLHLRFVKFNHKLVPTWAYVELSLDIMNSTDRRTVNNLLSPSPVQRRPGAAVDSTTRSGKTPSDTPGGAWWDERDPVNPGNPGWFDE